jgi:hypothetical protein
MMFFLLSKLSKDMSPFGLSKDSVAGNHVGESGQPDSLLYNQSKIQPDAL